MTQEQDALRAELIERYGAMTFDRACQLSGLVNCMIALARDDLSKEERERAYTRAMTHYAKLQATFITAEQSAALTECAKRIDVAVDMWSLDDLERREGLPRL